MLTVFWSKFIPIAGFHYVGILQPSSRALIFVVFLASSQHCVRVLCFIYVLVSSAFPALKKL